MGIFNRLSNLIRSKANAAIDDLSDPGKEVEQLILEMEEQLRRARGETVKSRAAEKLCAQRVSDLEQRVTSWGERAEAALRAGDEPLAREALAQQNVTEHELAEARRELSEASAYAAKLTQTIGEFEVRLQQYRLRKGTIKAKASQAQRDLRPGSTDAFAEFDRMAGKVDDEETAAEAHRELADDRQREEELAARIDRLPAASSAPDSMEARLAALKDKMGKKE